MVYSIIHPILHALGPHHLNTFKWHIENHRQIPASHLRSASAHDTVHLMMQYYGHGGALKITSDTLKKMNKGRLNRRLKGLVREGAEDLAENVLNHIIGGDDDDDDDDDGGEEEPTGGDGEGGYE